MSSERKSASDKRAELSDARAAARDGSGQPPRTVKDLLVAGQLCHERGVARAAVAGARDGVVVQEATSLTGRKRTVVITEEQLQQKRKRRKKKKKPSAHPAVLNTPGRPCFPASRPNDPSSLPLLITPPRHIASSPFLVALARVPPEGLRAA